MNETSITEYEVVDLSLPPIPPRSRLFSLEPIGVGTPYVESLTSYIMRLAEAHCVSPKDLLVHEVGHLMRGAWLRSGVRTAFNNTTCALGIALNSVGDTAGQCCAALENLCARRDLEYLTMRFWASVLSKHNLIRRFRAWCPHCYEEQIANGHPPYDQLAWALRVVEMCPRHRESLRAECPRCRCRISWLGPRSQTGHCPKCNQWLGDLSETQPSGGEEPIFEGYELSLWAAETVGEMLAAGPHLKTPPSKENLKNNLSVVIGEITDGSRARFMNLTRFSIRNWHAEEGRTQLASLLKFCEFAEINVTNMLTGSITADPTVSEAIRKKVIPNSPKAVLKGEPGDVCERLNKPFARRVIGRQRWDDSVMEQKMRDALSEMPPVSIPELAARYGFNEGTLRRYQPELCRLISARRTEHRRKLASDEVRPLLERALEEFPPPTMNEVVRRVSEFRGCRLTNNVRNYFPDLCRAIAVRHAAYRKECVIAKRELFKERVKQTMIGLRDKGIYPSGKRINRTLPGARGSRFNRLLRQVWEELDMSVSS